MNLRKVWPGDIPLREICPLPSDKGSRFLGVAALAEAGKVFAVAGGGLADFRSELESFPNGRFDDQCDAVSLGFEALRHNSAAQLEMVRRLNEHLRVMGGKHLIARVRRRRAKFSSEDF